jgi:hypothetical protein
MCHQNRSDAEDRISLVLLHKQLFQEQSGHVTNVRKSVNALWVDDAQLAI